MLRQLPQTITADATPDWLPVGWIVHSKPLKRGRETKTYTQLRTLKTFSTKDQVLEYIRMEKLREKREYLTERKKGNLRAFHYRQSTIERPPWLPDHWRVELKIGSICGNAYNMYVNTRTGFKTYLKKNVLSYENNMKSIVSSDEEDETECNEISYVIEEDEEDFSESEYVEDKVSWEDVENFSHVASTSQRSQPKRIKKLESRAKTQCIFIDEDMSSDSDNKLSEAETSEEENALKTSFEEKNLHNVVVECENKAREIPGLSGTLTVEINLDCEPASDSLVRKDRNKSGIKGIGTRNIEIIDLESDSSDMSDSSKGVGVNQDSGGKSGEPLKAQAAQEETAERSVFFPHREAPSNSVVAFDTSNARSSAEYLSNTMELGLDLQEKSISDSKKQKKNTKECSSKIIKMKGTEAPTKTLQKDKRPPSKSQGKKRNSSVVMQKKTEDWPDPCPYFPFEPITRSFHDEDDSVIRRYLEQYYRDQGSEDSNIPLPDFGLPSFSNIRISTNEEPESKRMESPGPPCVQGASSSLPSCSSIGSGMEQTVAGN